MVNVVHGLPGDYIIFVPLQNDAFFPSNERKWGDGGNGKAEKGCFPEKNWVPGEEIHFLGSHRADIFYDGINISTMRTMLRNTSMH